MILGIGCDISSVERIKKVFSNEKKIKTFFTQHEVEYFAKYTDPYQVIAGHFSAKEAVAKALGTGFRGHTTWQNIEIYHNELGAPSIRFLNELKIKNEHLTILISISHEKEFATAYAVLQK